MNSRSTPALHPSRSAAARSVGCIGGGNARRLSGRPLWNGPDRLLTNPSGLASTIGSSATGAAPTKRRYVRWPSSGSAFFTAAGKPAYPTTNQHISTRCGSAAPPCSNSFIELRKTLDGLPQGVKRSLDVRLCAACAWNAIIGSSIENAIHVCSIAVLMSARRVQLRTMCGVMSRSRQAATTSVVS